MGQLRVLISEILEIITCARIVVNGIDECSKENQKAITKELDLVYTGLTTRSKILFSSRREVHIIKSFLDSLKSY